MSNKLFVPVFFIVLLLISCYGMASKVKNLSPDDFEKGIANPGAQLVDVRTPEEYNEKHIAGAVNMDIEGNNFKEQLNTLDKSKPLYVYCLAGTRGGRAALYAEKAGFTNVWNLDKGITAWIGANKPVTTANGEPAQTGMSFDDYLAHIKSPTKLVLVDFNAVWCGPCKQLKPAVDRQVKKNSDKVELFSIDVDKNPKVASAMNINGIPLLILYKQGKEVWRSLGLIDESDLAGKIREFTK